MTSAALRGLSLAVLAAVAMAPPVSGQSRLDALVSRCSATGSPELTCTELAVAARSIQAASGLLAGLGSEVPGSAGTLGRRLGNSPRLSASFRTAFSHLGVPDLGDAGPGLSREATFVVPVVQTGIAAGVFDGFFILPTVGGVLSLDVIAQTTTLFLPTSEGFSGNTSAWSLGARLGLLRESFTLPGVALSLSRRGVAPVRLGSDQGPGAGAVEVDPSVVSLRATVGKDLLSVGLLAGVGWDRLSGSVEITPSGTRPVRAESYRHTRKVVFGGASMNFLILQISAEGGWGSGLGEVDVYRGGAFDPARGTGYGSLAFRLTL